MPSGFDFRALYSRLGELQVARAIIGFIGQDVAVKGAQGFNVRAYNWIRGHFGLSSQHAARDLFNDVRDNVDAARRLRELRDDDRLASNQFPTSSNVLGGSDGSSRYVYSGDVELSDRDGDIVRKVPFLIESERVLSQSELSDLVGESVHQFVEKYLQELKDTLGGGGLFPTNMNVTFIAQRD